MRATLGSVLRDWLGLQGRNGNQPRGTRVVGNLVREFGVWQKQSSAWAQQLVAETWIESNVMFNCKSHCTRLTGFACG